VLESSCVREEERKMCGWASKVPSLMTVTTDESTCQSVRLGSYRLPSSSNRQARKALEVSRGRGVRSRN
jgi:hypothetical protein